VSRLLLTLCIVLLWWPLALIAVSVAFARMVVGVWRV
jgi:hypothetical protein